MKTPQQRILKWTVILVGVLVVGLAGTCGYQCWAIAATGQRITAETAAWHATQQRTDEQKKLLAQQQALLEHIAKRPATWAWSDQLPLLAAQVYAIMDDGGVKVDTLQPEPIVTKQQVACFPLRMTLHSDLQQITKILLASRQATPALAMDHFTVRAGQTTADPLQIECTLSSFVMLEGKPKGGKR
jgi:enoyl-CoA hydratase/carnithine racemase